MDRIGVRELRQHASRYLERVARGETLEVTDRGRPVARLVPVTADPWADMIAGGRVTLAEDDTDVADEAPGDYEVDASAVLAAMRSDER
jgi:prevent-host-death family protein